MCCSQSNHDPSDLQQKYDSSHHTKFTTNSSVSANLVPLTIVKGAGHEFIPLPQGENATTADFHSIRTKTTDSPTHLTSGFYKIVAGKARPAHYNFEETKYILSGQIDILVCQSCLCLT